MKLWIVLALIGMASAAPFHVGAQPQGRVSLGMAIKRFCPIAQTWVVDRYITDPDEMARIAAEQAGAINVINVNDASDIKCNTGEAIFAAAPTLSGPEIVLPCAAAEHSPQTKVVQRRPCFRGYAPIEIDVDGQKWKCTHIGRKSSPCLPAGRVVDRACTKTIAKPEIVIVDDPCAALQKVLDPCSVSSSSSSSSSQEIKIVHEPCEVEIPEPCSEKRVVEPCTIELPEIKISSSASASACADGTSASAEVNLPDLGTALGDLNGSLTASFSSSASASASSSSSSSFSL